MVRFDHEEREQRQRHLDFKIGVHAALILNKFKTTATLSEQAREVEKPDQQEHPAEQPDQANRNEGPRRALA
jgi:hypothetical protein